MNHALWGTVFWAAFLSGAMAARAEILPDEAAAYFDFHEGVVDRAPDGRALRLRGAKLTTEGRLEFTGPLQWAELVMVATRPHSAPASCALSIASRRRIRP
jgi:hypothetical protein